MIDFLSTLPTFDRDEAAKVVWSWIRDAFKEGEGICYYKQPVIVTTVGTTPDLTLLTRSYQPLAIRCLSAETEEIEAANQDTWVINGKRFESPLLELEDFVADLKGKLDRTRILRHRLDPQPVLALPLISRASFEGRFGNALEGASVLWADGKTDTIMYALDHHLNEQEWQQARSVFQGVVPLKSSVGAVATEATKLGEAIRILDKQIAVLDREQERAALQIAPGPQRIRGLAGTGKTVLLAMKAASIHWRLPDKRILFTFNTKSLYDQTRTLISKFYSYQTGSQPDWNMLQVMHAWGGRDRCGVYYDLCVRQGIQPLDYASARRISARDPFAACCKQVLANQINPEYDFVLVDEAQDFPKEFRGILYQLTYPQHCIYLAYDELQNLFSTELPKPEDWFGVDEQGKPVVTFDGDDYPGGIERDLVLKRSYRCPQTVLMLAHAIGLGLYNPKGRVQMLAKEDSWRAMGYEIESGQLLTDQPVVVYRPPSSSPNPIRDIYRGPEPLVRAEVFDSREDELDWVAGAIQQDIQTEQVAPEQIVVISLDTSRVKDYFHALQRRLAMLGISATVPGISDDSAVFRDPGKVTLATVSRAKGNEASIVYIISFDWLYDYVYEIESRNRAFTSITRSKAWVRISGVGEKMEEAKKEIDAILADEPRFRFVYQEVPRQLDAVTYKRQKEVAQARGAIETLADLGPEAIAAAAARDPELLKRLRKVVESAGDERK